MVSKEDVGKELNYLTEKISTLVWTLNVGALGLAWSLLITSSVAANVRFSARHPYFCLCPRRLNLCAT